MRITLSTEPLYTKNQVEELLYDVFNMLHWVYYLPRLECEISPNDAALEIKRAMRRLHLRDKENKMSYGRFTDFEEGKEILRVSETLLRKILASSKKNRFN